MAVDDFLDSHVAVAVAGTTVVLSPRARRLLRRGAVYGLAGAMMAGDAIGSFARAAARGARETTAPPAPPTPSPTPSPATATADARS